MIICPLKHLYTSTELQKLCCEFSFWQAESVGSQCLTKLEADCCLLLSYLKDSRARKLFVFLFLFSYVLSVWFFSFFFCLFVLFCFFLCVSVGLIKIITSVYRICFYPRTLQQQNICNTALAIQGQVHIHKCIIPLLMHFFSVFFHFR